MSSNRLPARRWRVIGASQFGTRYQFPCRVSDRVAIVWPKAPYTWAVYGYPNEGGIPHVSGQASSFAEAKRKARISLDDLAANPPWVGLS